jgi:hypothetical protein
VREPETRTGVGRWGRNFLLFAAAAFCSAAASQGPVPLRSAELLAERDGVSPGETLSLVVRITLHRDFHVNSHVPSQEYLIPTRLETDPAEGFEFGDWIYPEGEMKKFPFSEEPLRVYEGTFLIRGSLKAGAGAALGERRLTVRLRYQSCTREKCLAPRVEEIPLDLQVVAPGTAQRRLHSDLFPAPGR